MISKIASVRTLDKSCRGLKVGDKVIVTRKATTEEKGWENSWVDKMNDCIGKYCTVEFIEGTNVYFETEDDSYGFGYPWFVLAYVEDKFVALWGDD